MNSQVKISMEKITPPLLSIPVALSIVVGSAFVYGLVYLIAEKSLIQSAVAFISTPIILIASPLVLFLIGFGLFNFREKFLFYFSLVEMSFGIGSGVYVLGRFLPRHLTLLSAEAFTALISVGGAVFIIIRGLDNFKKSKSLQLKPEAVLGEIERSTHRIYALEKGNVLYSANLWDDLDDWDAIGNWHMANSGVLEVSNSSIGGYYLNGKDWHNYKIGFKCSTKSNQLNWIVRASENGEIAIIFENKKLLIQKFSKDRNVQSTETIKIPNILATDTIYKIETICENDFLKISIDNFEVCKLEMLKDYTKGTIGFRNNAFEPATYRRIRVIQIPKLIQ